MTMTPEERKARRKEVRARCYAKHRAENLAYAASYREANAAEIKAKTVGKHAAYSARYREKNYDRCLQMTQAWKDANPERRRAMQAAWTQANLDKHRTYQHNRRARKVAAGGSLSPDLPARLLVAQRGRCACCRKPLRDDYEMDHIVPFALGGANTDENIQLLTSRCNRQKGFKHPVAFMQQRGMLL